jgi:cytokinin riboside 5'-monophosphate phosphoribohydrolase
MNSNHNGSAKHICVYCSSSDMVAPEYFAVAEELGAAIGRRGHTLVYGGTNVGLMGACAKAAQQQGAKVVGIIPSFIAERGLAYDKADELIVTDDMRQRKALMEQRSDAFVALPGGFGTLEEMFEIITLKQLQRHNKAIVFLNAVGYYEPLAAALEHMYEAQFAKEAYRRMYNFAPDVASAMQQVESYRPAELPSKWGKAAVSGQ